MTMFIPPAPSTILFGSSKIVPKTMVAVSDNGYVRLSYAELQAVRLIHRISGLDEAPATTVPGGATLTVITGYTEWVGDSVVTIGWDWRMDAAHNSVLLYRTSEPRSNVMIRDAQGADVGPVKTIALLETFIDALEWQSEVRKSIDIRYG